MVRLHFRSRTVHARGEPETEGVPRWYNRVAPRQGTNAEPPCCNPPDQKRGRAKGRVGQANKRLGPTNGTRKASRVRKVARRFLRGARVAFLLLVPKQSGVGFPDEGRE